MKTEIGAEGYVLTRTNDGVLRITFYRGGQTVHVYLSPYLARELSEEVADFDFTIVLG